MGIANANSILDIISYTRHGTKESACYNDLLLDNIDLPNDITLVSLPKEARAPSPLNNSSSENLQNAKTYSSDKCHTAKIKGYINQKFDQAAWKYLKCPILTEIKNHLDKNNINIKKIESKILGTTITTLLEGLDQTSKPLRVKCTC